MNDNMIACNCFVIIERIRELKLTCAIVFTSAWHAMLFMMVHRWKISDALLPTKVLDLSLNIMHNPPDNILKQISLLA